MDFLARLRLDANSYIQEIHRVGQAVRQEASASPAVGARAATPARAAEQYAQSEAFLRQQIGSGRLQLPPNYFGVADFLNQFRQQFQRGVQQVFGRPLDFRELQAGARRAGVSAPFTPEALRGGVLAGGTAQPGAGPLAVGQLRAEIAELQRLSALTATQSLRGRFDALRERFFGPSTAAGGRGGTGTPPPPPPPTPPAPPPPPPPGGGGRDLDPDLRRELDELVALARQVPEAIRKKIGVTERHLRETIAALQSQRRGGPEGDAATQLKGRYEALAREIGLRYGTAEEVALRRADRRPDTGPGRFTPGPVTELRSRLTAVRREREVVEQTSIQQQYIADTDLRRATAALTALRRQRDILDRQANVAALEGLQAEQAQTRVLERRAAAMQRRMEAELASKPVSSLTDAQGNPIIGSGRSLDEEEAGASTAKARGRAAQEAMIQRELAVDREYIQNTAAAAAARKVQRAQIAATERQLLGGIAAEAGIGEGSWFQRLQANISRRQTGGTVRLAQEFPELRQFLQARALTTAGFAASGALLYGGVAFIREMVREASELQVELGLVKSQFDEAGLSAERFGQFRGRILDISKETGVAADELARLSRNLLGVFRTRGPDGLDTGPDVGRVEVELETAAKFSQVTGVAAPQIKDDMVAIVSSFRDLEDITFESVADQLIGLENRTGTASGELLNFTASLAPLAAELGFTSKELAALGAVASQVSGKAPSTLSENIGRVLTDLSDKAGPARQKLLEFYNTTPAVEGGLSRLAESFASNDIEQVVRQLLTDFNKLDQGSRAALAKVFGRREAQSFIALLNNADVALRELNRSAADDQGNFDERWREHSKTVTFAFQQMERAVEELGIALFEAGLGDALKTLAAGGSLLLQVFEGILSVFRFINERTGGLVGRLVAVAVAIRAIAAATAALGRTQTGMKIQATLGIAQGVQQAAQQMSYAQMVSRGAGGVGGLVTPAAGAGAAAGAAARGGLLARLGAGLGLGTGAAAGPAGIAVLLGTLASTYAISHIQSRMQRAQENASRFAERLEKATESQLAALDRGEQVKGFDFEEGFFGPSRRDVIDREQARRAAARNAAAARAGINEIINRTGDAIRPRDLAVSRANADRRRQQIRDEMDRRVGALYGPNKRLDPDEEGRLEAIVEERSRRLEIINRAEELVADPEKLDEAIRSLSDVTKGGRAGERARANSEALRAAIDLLPPVAREQAILALEQARVVQRTGAAEEQAAKVLEANRGNVELMVALFRRGTRSRAQVAAAFARDAREYQVQIDAAKARGSVNEEAELNMDRLRAAEQQFADELYSGARNRLQALGEITGNETGYRLAQVEQALLAIRDPDTSLEGDVESAKQVVSVLRTAFARRLTQVGSFAEMQRIMAEGFQLPPEVMSVIARTVLDNPAIRNAVTDYTATLYPGIANEDERLQRFADDFVALDEAGRQAAMQVVLDRIASLERFLELMEGGGTDFFEADAADIRSAIAALRRVYGGLQQADAAIKDQNAANSEEFRKAAQEVFSAQKALAESMTRDPVELARIAQRYARQTLELARASGDATAIMEAQAQVNEANQQLEDALNDIALSQYDVAIAIAQASGDSVAAARAQLNRAEAEYRRAVSSGAGAAAINQAYAQVVAARQSVEDAIVAQTVSFLELAAAHAAGNAQAVAQIQLQIARTRLAAAGAGEARNRALAELVNAQRAYDQTLLDASTAQHELAVSVANFRGDSVRAATEQLAAAREQLNFALAHGAGPAEIRRAMAQIVQAHAALRDAQLAEQQSDIDFALQMERITTAEAIRQLEALLKIPNLTKQQTQQLLLRIKQLRDELGADFQFNLPSFLGLPTLYEARRVNQVGGTGAYQDNRRYDIRVTTQPGQDNSAIAREVLAAIDDDVTAPPVVAPGRFY